MDIINNTDLDTRRIEAMFSRATAAWPAPNLKVTLRYSRGAKYSGTFASDPSRIYVNIGRTNRYPLKIETAVARAKSSQNCWWKPLYHINVQNAYQLALFVFLHEFYHYLIYRAKRNSRQKESMCDRFAVKYLVEHCRIKVVDTTGLPVKRSTWLFQNLDKFVLTQRTAKTKIRAATRPRT